MIQMCVYCEIPSTSKEGFYNEYPELKGNDIVRLQINIVGDLQCGKTSLIEAYGAEQFSEIPSVSRYACYKLTKVNDKPAEIILIDTIGLEDFNDPQKRSLIFIMSEVTILCYSVNSWESFANISGQWFPEIVASNTKKPVILVGLKKELRSDTNVDSDFVPFNEGKALAKSLGASGFMECSSTTGKGVIDVFELAINKSFGEYKKDNMSFSFWKKFFCCTS